MELGEPSSIIVRMPNWLGDVVMATPVLAALREKWPKAFIVAMIAEKLAPLLEKDPRINEIFAFTKPSGFLRRLEARQIISRLREGHYDLGVLLTNSFSSAWWLYRGHVEQRLGYGRPLILNKSRPFPKNYKKQHLIHSYLQLIEGPHFKSRMPELFLSRDEKEAAKERMRGLGGKIVIGVNPAAAFGPAKCWPADRFRSLAQKLLLDERLVMVFFGDRAAVPLIEEMTAGLQDRVINLAGRTTLRELMALIGATDLFLTNDSGPMHIAAALGVPLLALFGSTSTVMTGPYKQGRVLQKETPCAPCFLRSCPLDFRCMKAIEVEEVMKTIQEMLHV